MSKLNPDLKPFVESAKQDYINSCNALPEAIRNQKKAFSRCKYYDMLADIYEGRMIKEVAAEYGYKYNSVYSSIMETQNRVENFAKYNGLI